MTVREDADESPGGDEKPKLASLSTKGLFTSLRERGDDVVSTPEAATPKGTRIGGLFSSTPRAPGSPAILAMTPLRTNINKLLTPSRTFSRLRDEREEISRLTPSPASQVFRDGFSLPLIGEVKPEHLFHLAKDWLRNPKNLALLCWGIAVGVSGAILFMVMVGMLDAVLPSRTARNTWFEVSNQIINALFTLMCLYLHPQRCLHLHFLWRWSASDVVKLRNIYCKNGTRKPHEWGHMLVVVLLLQLNCFAQYALCGLNWGYRRAERPAVGVAICLSLALGGGAGAGIYNSISPLGRDFEPGLDDDEVSEELEKVVQDTEAPEFAPRTKIYRMLERRVSFACRDEGHIVESPKWKGGLFDIRSDPPVSILSTLCCVCVFGWNMERLGFGNRFVHIFTFALICTSPFWIFDLAALNIDNSYVRRSIGGAGIVLCVFGLFYGGFWRIRMRERFKLPGYKLCCNRPNVTDCFLWLCLPLCSLCQEVRTAEHYDVKDDKFYSRSQRRAGSPLGSPLPGAPSPRTPGPSLSAIRELSDGSLNGRSIADVEMLSHDSPYEQVKQNFNTSPMVAPTPVVASKNPFSSSQKTSEASVASPPRHPFVHPDVSGTNPFLAPVRVSERGTESPPRTSSVLNPFLRPEMTSGGSSPAGSPSNYPFSPARSQSNYPFSQTRSPNNNPFTAPEVAADSVTRSPFARSPLGSPSRVSTSHNPFSPPEMSSSSADSNRSRSPLHRSGVVFNNPFSPPEMSSDASPLRTSSVPTNLTSSAGEEYPERTSSSSPNNPFLKATVEREA